MSMQSSTRSGGNAPGLPGGSLTRRSALRGSAAAVALSLAALSGSSVAAQAAPVAIVAPASSDADLIAFANRIAALADRCRVVGDHRATIEDQVSMTCPRPDALPQPSLFASMDIDDSSPTKRVITATKSFTYHQEQAAWESATAAAQAAHERQERAMEARLGLPEIVRRHDRMSGRCDRWAAQLAAMRPATTDGLTAKAAALLALVGHDRFSREIEVAHHADLVMSLLSDAVRLGAGGQA